MKQLLFTALFLSMITVLNAQAEVKPVTYTGYIADVLCGAHGKDKAGNNIKDNPGLHTSACMKMEMCVKSGYGIFILDPKTKLYTYYKFDKEGSDLAYQTIVLKTLKKKEIKIEITGVIDGKTIKLASIKEIK